MNKITKSQFDNFINAFDFSALFNSFGWDNFSVSHTIEAQNILYTVIGIAQKKDFAILQCEAADGKIPALAVRKQLEVKLRTLYLEHLLVFINKEKTEQHWQLPLREEGRLKRLVSFSWRKG